MCDYPPHQPSDGKARSISIRPSIYLDYGVDGATSEDAACEVCERGMRFLSRWRFSPNTLISVAFAFFDKASQRVEAEALVIDVQNEPGGAYLTTLAFIDAPEELRLKLGKVGMQLTLPKPSDGVGDAPLSWFSR